MSRMYAHISKRPVESEVPGRGEKDGWGTGRHEWLRAKRDGLTINISRGAAPLFRFGKLIFAHTGTLHIPDAVLERLGPLRRRVRGVHDSEVFFWQFVKFFRTHKDVARALEACCAELQELWAQGHRVKGRRRPHAGLNTLISDGEKVYAFCRTAGRRGRLVYGRRGGRVIIATEPMDDGRWHDLRDGELLEADASGAIRRRQLKLAC